ncbi:YceI family protein [Solitalea koreensis]|uniref:Polyisoprenoid-binding protein YceI n=1 Tax=Solitalea koreensis TaxID=543615 RepID=A0A521B9N8_9SPHI|nr:YceI family protein [Solitalea koreensis]SMO43787.1 Polyisoprenoid-binding protein YceI [Solitalea koreensis]
MKKLLIIIALSTIAISAKAQVYVSNSSKVSFFSKTSVEDISAVNTTASILLNATTDSLYVRIKNTSFTFERALMQEHFNENYMESSKYPISSFRGKLNEKIDFSKDGTYTVNVTGKLNLHGVEQLRTFNGTMEVKNGKITLSSSFKIKPQDHNIEIPKLVFTKIAELIDVNVSGALSPYQKKGS